MGVRLTVDAVEGPDGVAVLAIACEPDGRELAPPGDLRFANERALREIADDHAPADGAELWCAPRVGDDALDLVDRVRDLVAAATWASACRGRAVDEVVTSERVGRWQTEGEARAMPAPTTLAVELRRVAAAARVVGLPSREPTCRTVAFGAPSTPVELYVARARASLEAQTPGAGGARTAPPRRVLARCQRAVALMDDAPVPLLALARELHDLQRDVDREAWPNALVEQITDEIVRRFADPRGSAAALAAARTVVAELEGVADARQGDYEACELACGVLERADAGRPLIDELGRDDGWLRARFWLVRSRIANHRGHPEVAARASRDAITAAREEGSVRARLLVLEAENLAVVAVHDDWPYEAGTAGRDALAAASDRLERAVTEIRPLFEALGDTRDPILGAALGTLGRSHAFLGDHARARRLLIEARGHFASRLDRTINACFLTHLELDEPHPNSARLGPLFEILAPTDERDPACFVAELDRGNLGARFVVDLILKSLVVGAEVAGIDRRTWITALEGEELRSALRRSLTHPTELIARHAGELTREVAAAAAARWFELAHDVARHGGPTMRRVDRFTARLAQGLPPDAGSPRGSVDNPCFEYR